MKYIAKIVALLISIIMLVSQLSSCAYVYKFITDVSTDILIAVEDDKNEEYVFEIVYPQVAVSSLKFVLTDEHLDDYKIELAMARRIFEKNEGGSEDKFKNAIYKLLSLEAYMETQCNIAYLQYYYDTSDTVAWNNYLYAYDLRSQAHELFWSFYADSKTVANDLSTVFKGVIDKEFQGNLLLVDSDAHDYSYDMQVLKGEYNALQNSDASDAEIFATYKEYMQAAYGYATASSVDNYYEYASKYMYQRSDTAQQREALREYTRKYLVPLCKELSAKSKEYDSGLFPHELMLSNRYLLDSYDSFSENYLFKYFSSLPESSEAAIKGAFSNDRVLIGDDPDSYDTAMVYNVGNTPVCYFHEELTSLETMAHELGHYYAEIAGDCSYYSYSLKETHSTANAMLLYSYLSDNLSGRAFKGAELYMISNWVYQTILSVIKDEFDELIFSRDPSALELTDFNRIMSDLIDEYGVRDMSSGIEDQLMTYWKRQGVTYPMSNYSYAAAFTASFQIYIISKEDYSAATEIYRKIVEEVQGEGEFLETVRNAGLTTPYDEQTYVELNKLKDLY